MELAARRGSHVRNWARCLPAARANECGSVLEGRGCRCHGQWTSNHRRLSPPWRGRGGQAGVSDRNGGVSRNRAHFIYCAGAMVEMRKLGKYRFKNVQNRIEQGIVPV